MQAHISQIKSPSTARVILQAGCNRGRSFAAKWRPANKTGEILSTPLGGPRHPPSAKPADEELPAPMFPRDHRPVRVVLLFGRPRSVPVTVTVRSLTLRPAFCLRLKVYAAVASAFTLWIGHLCLPLTDHSHQNVQRIYRCPLVVSSESPNPLYTGCPLSKSRAACPLRPSLLSK